MKSGRIRYELKFLLDASGKQQLLERWMHLIERDPHTDQDALTQVLSRYYDSPFLDFHMEKQDGIPLRNKVRLRAYGHDINPGDTVFLEIKQRIGDRVRKYRQRVEDYRQTHEDVAGWRYEDRVAAGVLARLDAKYHLVPSVQVWYQREAYFGVENPDVRITFDSGIRAMYPGEKLTGDIVYDSDRFVLPETVFVLEVKLSGGLPAWVTDGIRAACLVQETVPKYVLAVERLGFANNLPSGAYV